jgi:hypothetical protein
MASGQVMKVRSVDFDDARGDGLIRRCVSLRREYNEEHEESENGQAESVLHNLYFCLRIIIASRIKVFRTIQSGIRRVKSFRGNL